MAKYTKNKRGYYHTGVQLGYDENGRRITKWLTARTIAELERKIMDVKNDIASGRDLLTGEVLFGDYADIWLKTYKANRGVNTLAMYRNLIERRFLPLCGLKVRDIRSTHLQALINDCGALPRTCEQMRMALRQIFKQAIEDDIITKNPAASLELPRHVRKEKRALTSEEKAAVLAADLTERERAFVMILFGCGLRPGELYALTWQDIDFKNAVINVNKSLVFENNSRPRLTFPKTNKSIRAVDAPKGVLNALKAYRATTIAPKLFGSPTGDYKGLTGYCGEWKRIKKKIEKVLGHETDLTMYCFRHNYASELYYAEISLKEAQRLMGHNSYKMIMDVYAHLDAKKENTKNKLDLVQVWYN
jgi:integrase